MDLEMIISMLEEISNFISSSETEVNFGDITQATDPTTVQMQQYKFYKKYQGINNGYPFLRVFDGSSPVIDPEDSTGDNGGGLPNTGNLREVIAPLIYGDRYRYTFPYVNLPSEFFTNK
jgi:hypothetical protein